MPAKKATSKKQKNLVALLTQRRALPFVVLFAVIGVALLIKSFADIPVVPPAQPNAGIWVVWDDKNNTAGKLPFVKGGQVVGEWNQVEPAKDTFRWDKLKNFKNYTDPTATPYINKPFTIQVNGTSKPKDTWWGYNSNVAWCGTFHSAQNDNFTQDVPQFWNASRTDGLNMTYMGYLDDMLTNLNSSMQPYSGRILGVRTAPNLIGTEHSSFKDPKIRSVPSTPICNQATWQYVWGRNAYGYVMNLYKEKFTGNIKPIYRGDHYALGGPRGMLFNTNSSPDTRNQYRQADRPDEYYDHVRNGTNIAYYEPFNQSSHYSSPVTWNWWLILENLSRGVNYIAVYGKDLEKAATGPCPENILASTGNKALEYEMAYCFANKYAPYANAQHIESKAQASPGAWIAFTRDDLSQNRTGYLSMYMTSSNLRTNSTQANIKIDNPATNEGKTYPNNSDAIAASGGSLGNPEQRYGRFARTIPAGNSVNIQLTNQFKSVMHNLKTVNVTYLDAGRGKWTLRWGATGSREITKTDSNDWKTFSILVPAEALKEAAGLNLYANTATMFHMVEVTREQLPGAMAGTNTLTNLAFAKMTPLKKVVE